MEQPIISRQELLQNELQALKTERNQLENRIASKLASLHNIAENPVPYLKQTLRELAADKEVNKDLLKVGAHAAANYVIDRYKPVNMESLVSGWLARLGGSRTSVYKDMLSALVKRFVK